MAYDFSPAGVIREAGFVSPSPSENFTDDGNFFSVYYYQGDKRLPFTRWTKGMQGGISTPDQDGELLGFDGLDGRHSYNGTREILNAMKQDYPDLAKDYEKYEWTGSLTMSQARTREGFLEYMKECALLGRRLQRYLDGKDPYGKEDYEIAQEHLKELWTAIRDQGSRTQELSGYEFQLSKKDHNVAWFTGTGRGNWFTITYDPANKNINVSKKRLGSTDIAEADEAEITARAVVDAIVELLNSKVSAASKAIDDTNKSGEETADTATTKDNDTVESDDGFIVEVVDSNGRLRVQGDDGVHGTAWVRFPNNLRTKAGRKYKVDQLKWNGKNYTIGGYINFVEDNGSLTRLGQVKLTEDTEDKWNKEALDIDKENTERVLSGLTGKDPLEEEKDKKTLTNGIDVDKIMKQLKRLEGKKQLKDMAVSGPDVDKVKLTEDVNADKDLYDLSQNVANKLRYEDWAGDTPTFYVRENKDGDPQICTDTKLGDNDQRRVKGYIENILFDIYDNDEVTVEENKYGTEWTLRPKTYSKNASLTEDADETSESMSEFSLPYAEALEILQMLSPEQVEKLVIKFNLQGEDQDDILDLLTDYVTDSELEKIRENPEGYLAIEAEGEEEEGEEPLEEDARDRYQLREYDGPEGPWGVYDTKEKKFVQAGSKKVMSGAVNDLNKKKGLKEEKSLRDIILLTEDINNPQTVDEWLDKIEKQAADLNTLMNEILVDFRKNAEDIQTLKQKVLGESKKDEKKSKLAEAVKELKTRAKKLLEDIESDPEAVLADSDAEIEVDNDIDVVDTEDKVILDMTTEEGKQEALEVLVELIPDEGISVEVQNDDGTTDTFQLEKEVVAEETVEETSTEPEEKEESTEKPEDDLEEDIDGTGNKEGSVDMTEDADKSKKDFSDLAAETKLEIDDKGKVTSGQAVKTIKSKVAKYNKANKTDYKVDYISETDSIVIS